MTGSGRRPEEALGLAVPPARRAQHTPSAALPSPHCFRVWGRPRPLQALCTRHSHSKSEKTHRETKAQEMPRSSVLALKHVT